MAHHELKSLVQTRVQAALGADKAISKADIYREFAGQGASRSTIHRWIDEAVFNEAGRILIARGSPPDPMPVAQKAVALADSAAPTKFVGIDPLDKIQTCFNVFEALLRSAHNTEGKIRNSHLAGYSASEIRKTVIAMKHLQAEVQRDLIGHLTAFMKDLSASLYRLDPEIGEPILAEMRELGHGKLLL